MKYRAVIFDLDGTLLNSLVDIADSVNFVLKKHNLPTHKMDDYKIFIGNGIVLFNPNLFVLLSNTFSP